VPSGYQSPRVPLIKKKMCFGDSDPNKHARGKVTQVRLSQAWACGRQTRQRLKEGFSRIIVGH
jgi:hypothetical protein